MYVFAGGCGKQIGKGFLSRQKAEDALCTLYTCRIVSAGKALRSH